MLPRDSHSRLSRRAVIAPLLSLIAAPILARRSMAQTHDDPPPFQTTRSQFTLVQPLKPLPPVTLHTLAGQSVSLQPVAGKVMLIHVWASWCPACTVDLPLFESFYEAVGDQVVVAAVSVDKSERTEVKAYLAKLGIKHLPIYLDPNETLASSSTASPAPLPIYGMPITYLIDAAGQIAGYISGVVDWRTPEAQRLLAYYAS